MALLMSFIRWQYQPLWQIRRMWNEREADGRGRVGGAASSVAGDDARRQSVADAVSGSVSVGDREPIGFERYAYAC
jgi:hypothetical protein